MSADSPSAFTSRKSTSRVGRPGPLQRRVEPSGNTSLRSSSKLCFSGPGHSGAFGGEGCSPCELGMPMQQQSVRVMQCNGNVTAAECAGGSLSTRRPLQHHLGGSSARALPSTTRGFRRRAAYDQRRRRRPHPPRAPPRASPRLGGCSGTCPSPRGQSRPGRANCTQHSPGGRAVGAAG